MTYRTYDPERDEAAAIRIWTECGWLKPDVGSDMLEAFRAFLACGDADVAQEKGAAECLVSTHAAFLRVLKVEVPFCVVSSVTVSRVLRQRGAAGTLLARVLARAAEAGDAAAGLGIFDQGFYDKLGFGCYPYLHRVSFDPLDLQVPRLERSPIRLSRKDIPRMVANIMERRPNHGMVRIPHPDFYRLETFEPENGFGLGFEDEDGRLSSHFWATAKGESGPYEVHWTAFRDFEGLLELLSAIRSLGDQVQGVIMREPYGVQIQDLLKRPFRNREIVSDGPFRNQMTASSWKQIRILDLNSVLEPLALPAGRVEFNLELRDPIERFLAKKAGWRGLSGSYVVRLDAGGSRAEPGSAAGLPLMRSSVNAFSRLVFGVAPASGLAATDELEAPEPLVRDLDEKLLLPRPEFVQLF